jgi:NAD(P)-dependent dehydrogenase (short-subunit alcohol dehydrogenase family)
VGAATFAVVIDRFRLDGQVAVVTGSGRGIGRAIAIGLAQAGAQVVVTARRRAEIDATASEIGPAATAIDGDIRQPDTNARVAARAIERFGRLDIWVNNAGGSDERVMRKLADTPDHAWHEQIDLNLTAPFLGARAACAHLGDGGSIVNIASITALRPSANNGPYAAAKAGLVSLTATLAAELAPRRVRVNAIAPGPVPTEVFMEALHLTPEQLPAVAAQVPLGRLGEPEDIAAAVVFLASPAASWITGQVLTVAGGMR